MNLDDELRKVWEDQRAFNLLFRNPPETPEKMAEQARDFVVFTESELHELLRTLPWKKHRRMPFRSNTPHMHEEGADIFKYVISLLQIIGIETPEQMIELYWRKTAVVRQRYQEEWMLKLDGPCVVVDIDSVLCDYITGMGDWLMHNIAEADVKARIPALVQSQSYLTSKSLGIPEQYWQDLKHAFRTEGAKRRLPVYPDARIFLEWVKMNGWRIVLLTSRPIDQYPNIFTDTLLWLQDHRLPFDFVWWSTEKAERVLQMDGLREQILFAVDDDLKFINQFRKAGIPSFWLRRTDEELEDSDNDELVTVVRNLFEVTSKGEEADGIRGREAQAARSAHERGTEVRDHSGS